MFIVMLSDQSLRSHMLLPYNIGNYEKDGEGTNVPQNRLSKRHCGKLPDKIIKFNLLNNPMG